MTAGLGMESSGGVEMMEEEREKEERNWLRNEKKKTREVLLWSLL